MKPYTPQLRETRDFGFMTSPLGKLFGRSPIEPIQQHMQLAQETVQLLCELLAASADQDWTRVAEIHSVIDSTTAEARKLRREIRQHLPRGLLLAMPRPDLLELLDIQNRITVCVREIARPVALRGMQFPPALQTILDKLCSLLAATVGEALTAIRELDELITQGFGKRERRIMEKMLISLERQVSAAMRSSSAWYDSSARPRIVFPSSTQFFITRSPPHLPNWQMPVEKWVSS